MARYQPSNVNCLLGLPDDSLESFLGEEWEEMTVDKNNHKHLKHHQASVCGMNNRADLKVSPRQGKAVPILPAQVVIKRSRGQSQTDLESVKLNRPDS